MGVLHKRFWPVWPLVLMMIVWLTLSGCGGSDSAGPNAGKGDGTAPAGDSDSTGDSGHNQDGAAGNDSSDSADGGTGNGSGNDTGGNGNGDGGNGSHAANPFNGADGYINPDYEERVHSESQKTGGELGARMAAVAQYSTAVWMDRIAAIYGGPDAMSLSEHLDAALAQKNDSTPMTILVVVYDLPNRDCAALASNGELLIAQDGLDTYKQDYIDPIAEIFADPKYSSLRIVAIVEPDSLPNLVTNLNDAPCKEANETKAYVNGIRYAIDKLHPIPNVYIYLDIAHSGWLGWDSNFGPTVNLYTEMLKGTDAGVNSIDGFITNTANYTPLEEVYLPDANLQINYQQINGAGFYESNPYFDELDFATALRSAFVNAGLPRSIGMLIDTSRNGWGGDDRPDQVSTSNDLNTYVDESRIDRRPHRGGWCNQAGAGIGARPQAGPASGIDAYVWVKPPGESDGVSTSGEIDPNDPNKKFDNMCNPDAQSRYNNSYPTNALSGAPHAGRWFSGQFRMLVENAWPPLGPDDSPGYGGIAEDIDAAGDGETHGDGSSGTQGDGTTDNGQTTGDNGSSDGTFQVDYTIDEWGDGFNATVTVTNNSGQDINGWTLTWTFADGQQVIGQWEADLSQSGPGVSAGNPAGHHNGTIPANGGRVTFGFQADHNGVNTIPVDFKLNGVPCNDGATQTTGSDSEDTDPAYYSAGKRKYAGAEDSAARTMDFALMDRMWARYRDDKGVSVTEARGDYERMDDAIYVPQGWTGTMGNGAPIGNDSTFL